MRAQRTGAARALAGLGLSALAVSALGVTAPAQAAYPGRNGFVAWTHYRNGGAHDIFRQWRDGTSTRQLTSDGKSSDPNWSPDGQRIAYVDGGRIAVMQADGSSRRLLSVSGSSPTWSPDGARLAYISGGDLRQVGAAGGASTLLLAHPSRHPYRDASWNPVDPDRILLNQRTVLQVSTGSTGPVGVQKVSASDTISSINWRPDGRSVVFLATCNATGTCNPYRTNIYVQALSGGPRTALTSRKECSTDIDCAQYVTVASAPDGNDVLYSEDENNGGGSFCLLALTAKLGVCSGPADFVEAGDWQSLH